MASSNQLKGYLKAELQKALGFTVDSEEFDKTMGAFAIAIDKYLKADIKVDINIEAKGILDITESFPTPTAGTQLVYDLDTKTTTTGKLV